MTFIVVPSIGALVAWLFVHYRGFAKGFFGFILFPVFLFSVLYLVLVFYSSNLNLNLGGLEALLYLAGFVFFLRDPDGD